ncbi:hypothetical protein AAZX31_20G054100 [Glycine max]|uniref:DUF868 domain-containing protein n=3 Tax=Glycine subgen. Soja TaxID=1462606 RepID=K7N1D0_SOYBN|nr:uncharacterized protein LOC100806502 [Glycine max]XP_028220149.1 uncharacterized protein LOC114401764 [Glycine soja]KAG4906845.1 hypothetical protein JHK86_055329 [Glycine max]KAG4909475.1 hypothetical protein JHK87_055591 [Glycine soja]KAG4918055.1 hypothetical protein JHK85_056336 [Glycine max]KAG5074134.1 hypothetical protein JHK84_055365 [Glycine max]KAG5076802.1 hypothetical protein JHK82_055497 [Glycine max]|eukprot:XP_003556772.1 uncharacterized protein LOC100806502 [Glycine max]
MPFQLTFKSQPVSNSIQGSSLVERVSEELLPFPSKSSQSTVTFIYQANVAGYSRHVSVLWCKNLMNHTLNLKVDSTRGDFSYTCKIQVKPWYFWNKKGYKSFEVDGHQVEVYWDLRSARFVGSSPEPGSDYYLAMVSDEEVVLLLGDQKKKAYKRMKMRPSIVEALLLVKRESVFAKKSFATKARFDEKRKENDIVVESSTFGNKEPEMWISIDGIVLIHVKNLQWNFRGNQTVMVNKQPVQVFWDVHDWLFSVPGSGPGLFIFKAGPVEVESEKEERVNEGCDSDNGSCASGYYSTLSYAPSESCLVLYAYKLE